MSKAVKSKPAKSKLRSAIRTLSKTPAKAAGKPHAAKARSSRQPSNEAKRATTPKTKSNRPLYLT
ncbi:MAG TPA: hypothetical protein VHX43_15205, partial [Xanthobacteraceae bacterium]|nr:hypothetical protein [Xanthobacteraceae bacterium]